ncbi:iron complex outermembrane receptor protein [Pseudoduganella lurida]|uniref:Iron complex outermembrane receptor protein n=1 Tax=Pseudoduganella lurida TaxID=1036180 RepID=A0A562RF86_9BURK|nr:TonB-dependent receptor [Pseudoduganella lurida]TWI67725.1 iron complex outermembrane receptor protein [Pseudoduganella lurida]
MQHRWTRPTLLAGLVAALCSPATHAQTTARNVANAADDGLQEVVVTAQRTTSLESKTPIAMSVLSGDALRAGGFDTPAELAKRLPNVHLDGAADGLKITIRGVSNSDATDKGDPSAAFLLDGIYIARPQNQNGLLLDVDRIEVLRGPQGTLYGRNTTAGAINVISHAPTRKLEAAAGIEAGNYNSRKASGMLNVPVGDALALRAAVAVDRHDSYLRNGQGTPHTLGQDRDNQAARLSARLALGTTASLLLRVDGATNDYDPDSFVSDNNFFRNADSGNPVWYGAPASARLTNTFRPVNVVPEQGWGHSSTSGVGAEFTWDLGPATLYYLGAHRRFGLDFLTNYIYRVAPVLTLGVRQNFSGVQEQDSHELRVATNGTGPLSAQAGLYYFDERSRSSYTFRDLAAIVRVPYYAFPTDPTTANSRAAFGQLTYRVTERLRATAGARYTTDEKARRGATTFQQGPVFNAATDLASPNAASIETDKRTWRLGADYDLTQATFVYASVATGYKAGGFNDGCIGGTVTLGVACPAIVGVSADYLYYRPETLRSYEAGAKARFWDKRASANLAVFKYDYTNLQLSGNAIVNGTPRFITTNAGVASVKGLELDGTVQATPDDRFTYGLTLLDAHYTSYSPDGVHSWAGRKLDRAPSHVLSLGYERRVRFANQELRAGVNARRSAGYAIGVPSKLVQYRIPAMANVDASLAWRPVGAAWNVTAYGRNLGNRIAPSTVDSFGMSVPGEPRRYGVRLDYSY